MRADSWDGCQKDIIFRNRRLADGKASWLFLEMGPFKHRSYKPSSEPVSHVEEWSGQRVESLSMRCQMSDKKVIGSHENV